MIYLLRKKLTKEFRKRFCAKYGSGYDTDAQCGALVVSVVCEVLWVRGTDGRAARSSFGAGCLGELGQCEDTPPRKHRAQSENDDDEVNDEEETIERQRHDAPLKRVSFAQVSLTELRHERPQHSLHLAYLVLHGCTDLDA